MELERRSARLMTAQGTAGLAVATGGGILQGLMALDGLSAAEQGQHQRQPGGVPVAKGRKSHQAIDGDQQQVVTPRSLVGRSSSTRGFNAGTSASPC